MEKPRTIKQRGGSRSLAQCQRGGTDFIELLCIFALVVVVGAMGAYAFGQSTERVFDENTQRVATFGDSGAAGASGSGSSSGQLSGQDTTSTEAGGAGTTGAASAASAASHGSNYAGIAESGSASAGGEMGGIRTAVDYTLVGVFILIAIAVVASVASRLKRRRKRRKEDLLKKRAVQLGEVMTTHVAKAASGTANGVTPSPASESGGAELGLPSVIVSA